MAHVYPAKALKKFFDVSGEWKKSMEKKIEHLLKKLYRLIRMRADVKNEARKKPVLKHQTTKNMLKFVENKLKNQNKEN